MKPCPFCGSGGKKLKIEEVTTETGEVFRAVCCQSCQAIGPYTSVDTEAKRLWDARTQQKAQRKDEEK